MFSLVQWFPDSHSHHRDFIKPSYYCLRAGYFPRSLFWHFISCNASLMAPCIWSLIWYYITYNPSANGSLHIILSLVLYSIQCLNNGSLHIANRPPSETHVPQSVERGASLSLWLSTYNTYAELSKWHLVMWGRGEALRIQMQPKYVIAATPIWKGKRLSLYLFSGTCWLLLWYEHWTVTCPVF